MVMLGLVLIMSTAPKSEQRAMEAANELMTLAENTRAAYRSKPNYWGLDTESALKSGIVPKDMIAKNSTIKNSLGQNVLIGSGKGGDVVMPGEYGFDIVFTGVNRTACFLLMQHNFSEEQRLGLSGVTLLNSQENVFSWGGEKAFPLSNTNARNLCEDKNIIIWNFE